MTETNGPAPAGNEDVLKFMGVDITNFKNIQKKIVKIAGRSLIVFGGNGKGKSSFIQALTSAFDAKLRPSSPIKKGEERAEIQLQIAGQLGGQPTEYMLDLHFTPGNQTGTLIVTDENKEKVKAPATLLKSILGAVSFDIMKFMTDTKEKKIKTLKDLSGRGKEIDLINMSIKEKKDAQKALKQRIEDAEAIMNNHKFTDDEVALYSEPVDVAPLKLALTNVSLHIDNFNQVTTGISTSENTIAMSKARVEQHMNSIADQQAKIPKIEEEATNRLVKLKEEYDRQVNETYAYKEQQLADINNYILDLEVTINNENNIVQPESQEYIDQCKAWLIEAGEVPSAESASQALQDAVLHNEKHIQINDLAERQRTLIKQKQDFQKGIEGIDADEKKRAKIIETSQLPIKGLSFTDDEIFYDGLPMEEGQINTAKLFDICTDIAIALNPTLRVIFLHEASLFDKDTLIAMIHKIEERGYQVIAEVVDWEGKDLDVQFTEQLIG